MIPIFLSLPRHTALRSVQGNAAGLRAAVVWRRTLSGTLAISCSQVTGDCFAAMLIAMTLCSIHAALLTKPALIYDLCFAEFLSKQECNRNHDQTNQSNDPGYFHRRLHSIVDNRRGQVLEHIHNIWR